VEEDEALSDEPGAFERKLQVEPRRMEVEEEHQPGYQVHRSRWTGVRRSKQSG
jgi:hypothetical protein